MHGPRRHIVGLSVTNRAAEAASAHSEISAKYSRVRTMLEVKPYSLS